MKTVLRGLGCPATNNDSQLGLDLCVLASCCLALIQVLQGWIFFCYGNWWFANNFCFTQTRNAMNYLLLKSWSEHESLRPSHMLCPANFKDPWQIIWLPSAFLWKMLKESLIVNDFPPRLNLGALTPNFLMVAVKILGGNDMWWLKDNCGVP